MNVVAGGFAVGLVMNGSSFGPAWAVFVLGALSALAERRPVRVNSNVEITVSILPVVFAAVVFGHSHQPSIETREGVLYINPGSAGPKRFKLPVTVARVRVTGREIKPEIIHLEV